MAEDQVKYSELIVDDGGIKALEDALNGIKMQMKELKSTAVVLGEALKNTSSANDSGRKSIRSAAAEIDALAKALRARQEAESKLAIEIAKVKEETREANAMAKYQAQLADAAAGSYKALSAQYSINKIILNSMSAEERKATEEGKKLEAETKAIYEEMKKLQEATGKHQLNVGNYADATKGLRSQIMELTEAMVKMRMEGKENTSEYADLQKKAGALKDAFADTQQEVKNMASDTSNLDVALGALSATSGGFAAVTGAMQLFGAESEDVQEAQKKLQASIALVNGVTAVQKNLQHQSALMLGVSRVQTYALAKAEAYERLIKIQGTNATIGATVAQKAFNLVAKANPYVLLATAFVTVVGAIWAFSAAAKSAAKEMEQMRFKAIALQNVNEGAAQSIGEMQAKYVALQKEWKNLKSDDIPEWLKQHKDDWQELGISIESANDAENLYVKNTSIILNAIDARARSVAAMKLAAEKYEEAFRKQVKAEEDLRSGKMSVGNRMAQALAGAGMAEGTGYLNPEQMAFQERAAKQAAQSYFDDQMKEVKRLQEEAKYYITTWVLPEETKGGESTTTKKNKTKELKTTRVSGSFSNSFNGVTSADVLVAEAKAMKDKGDTVLQTIQMWYDKRVAITNAAYEKEKETLAKEKKERLDSLTQNLNNAKVFESKYDALVAEVDKDPDLDEDGKKARKAELKRQLDEATELIASEKKQRENIDKYYKDREKIAEKKQQNELADLGKQRTEKLFKEEERLFKARQDADKRRFDLEKHNSIEQAKFNMEQEIASKQWQIDHAKELQLSEEQLAVLKEEVEWLNKKYNQGNYNAKRGNTGNYSNIMDVLFGEKITNDQISAINSVFDQAKEALNSWMDARKAAADQAKELTDDEVSAAENALNREIELRNQGYANNVALRERELADAKEKQKQAMEEQKKAAQEQILLDAALQTSSLITASANIWKQFATQPWLAAAMLATMWGSFSYAKIKAYQASTKSIKFREGGVMLLEGGSHESGHDVNLGIGPDGSNLRAEGGEYFAVINKRNSRKYGSEIPAVVNALNSGMFEDRYIKTSDAVGLLPRIIRADNGSEVDLSAVESGVGELVKQGESRWTVEGEYRVEQYKNRVRRVKIG